MEFAQLEMFVAVAEHGGITAAAEKLLRAPSNVSTRIRHLEKELGMDLLLRDKRQVTLSAEGEAFREYARRLIDIADEAKSLANGERPHGRFRIGALESTSAVRIPSLLAEFHLSYPEVDLELEAGASGMLFDHVLKGQVSAVFTDGPPASPVLTGMHAFTENLVILTPEPVKTIDDDFRQSNPTVFLFGTVCSYRQRFEDWLEESGIKPGRMVEISSYYSMLACVAAGAGICMMPRCLYESLPGSNRVTCHPIKGDLGRAETWLTWRRDARSANLRAFVRQVRAHLADLSEQQAPLAA
ncbi:LysR family transcriptional regulator [Streptomyces acidiscabies]|uniref:LysR family transcriptional regulator n=1 Tax=Streptomyces acidiscabies TaxID=42234 RepID=UPI000952873B|nr:LysR family transcriptional regulator [Streptomyces acidiscabies]